MAKLHRFVGFSKLLTVTYWRTRLALLWAGRPMLKVQEVVIGEMSEQDFAAAAENEFDTSDYILSTED